MKKKINLKGQIIVIFSIVSIVTAILFLIFLRVETRKQAIENDRRQQEIFLLETLNKIDNLDLHTSEYNGYVILKNKEIYKTYNTHIFIDENYLINDVVKLLDNPFSYVDEKGIKGNLYFKGMKSSDNIYQVITFTNGDFQTANAQDINIFVRVSFVSIILLGNIIILLWSTIIVERINILKKEVNELSSNEFTKPIEIQGFDEITELSKAIENMRISIEQNEKTKKEILQNVSHDIKTPIAVIKSYAEAIYDGISDKEDLNIIIKQSDILNKKVMQLLQLNKLEYIDNDVEHEKINLKSLFNQIIIQNKYRTKADIILDADDSVYYGIYDNLFIAFSNIIDNAIRYVKTKIVITVKNKKVTIYNDGELIDEKFINEGFKPYEKGLKGQFGLGLSISYKTFKFFNLTISVKNIDDGVMFTIKPLIERS